MATFDMDFVHKTWGGEDEAETLKNFAEADGCYRIYRIAMSPKAPHSHYVVIRKPQDEAAMRGSSSVHNPTVVWPLSERKVPLIGKLKTFVVVGDSLEEATEKAKKLIQQEKLAWFSEEVICDGRPKTSSIEVRANSVEDAKKLIPAQIPKGFKIENEHIKSDGLQKTTKWHGRGEISTEDAFRAALGDIPEKGIEIQERKVITEYQRRTFLVEAFDQETAEEKARQWATKNVTFPYYRRIKLKSPGRKGIIGIGVKPNKYEAEFIQNAEVELIYKPKALIIAFLEEIEKPKVKISIRAGKKELAEGKHA